LPETIPSPQWTRPFCRLKNGGYYFIQRKEEHVRSYELTVILRTGAKTEETKNTVKEILTKHGISIKEDLSWGVKRLAYSIEEEKDGYYMHLVVEAEPKSIGTISGDFHVNKEILRHMAVVRQDPKSA